MMRAKVFINMIPKKVPTSKNKYELTTFKNRQIAEVVLIHEIRDMTNLCNYSPISQLSQPYRIFVKAIHQSH